MKIYKFTNIETNEILYYKKKKNFTERFDVNERNLSFTTDEYKKYYNSLSDDEKSTRGRPRVHSKGWKQEHIEIDIMNFDGVIEDDGESLDTTLHKENNRLRKQVQNYQDKLRILRKEIRVNNREENSLNNTLGEILDLIEPYDDFAKIEENENNGKKVGIIHLSDLHFNKQVHLKDNTYNFEIAKQRLEKLFTTSVNIFHKNNIKEVVVIFTGDLFNLDKYDNKLTNEHNRAVGFYKGWEIMKHFLDNLHHLYKVSFAGIIGNESRIDEFFPLNNELAMNNFDWLLYQFIKERYPYSTYLNNGDKIEDVIGVSGLNIHISHGYFLKQIIKDSKTRNKMESLNEVRVRWLLSHNTKIDYFLFGHIHSPMITDEFGRSGSIVGGDDYSTNKLNIVASKPSQNIYVIKGKDIFGTIIRL